MAYSERLAELRLVTSIQLSSLRIAIEVGYELVVIGVGLSTVKLPVVVLTRKDEIAFWPLSTTYRKPA